MKRIWALLLGAALLTGCAAPMARAPENGRLRIVTTLFPYYDFARAIVGDRADVTLLLSPGREAHSFEPTPLDAVTISRADVLVYNGGESEEWVEEMLESAGEHIGTTLNMMEYVNAHEEEYVEGMQGAEEEHHHDHDESHDEEHDEDSDEIEYDEHIWTSPQNAITLCGVLCDALCEVDEENKAVYQENCAAYIERLTTLDARFRALRERAARDLIVFADRMPMLYFCEEYDLRYRAAFHGCSTDTEPSLATLKYLIDKVAEEDIPVVYTVDLDSRKIAEVVAECTGAGIETLYSLQTVSRADFDAGETYISLMERNYEALERGLA